MLTDQQKQTVMHITVKLTQLGHDLTFVEPVSTGPLITTYRFALRQASKLSQIVSLNEDLAMALGVENVTIRRLPGESVLGISVPNASRSVPLWRDALRDNAEGGLRSPLRVPLTLGVDEFGRYFYEDLTELPHLLIAGSTGSGKSVILRSLIASLCYLRKPDEVQLVLSDTKQVEFGLFDGDPHLYRPRARTIIETLHFMEELSNETELRLKMIAALNLQNIHQLPMQRRPPYLVLVIDELADFMGKSADKEVSKLATSKLGLIVQRSRAAGVYVIAATQRPSVDVVTGSIKSNFPARLSFRLPTESDSRTVLGHSGAEQLLSVGDCYYVSPLAPSVKRLHSLYATTDEIKACVELARTTQSAGVYYKGTAAQGKNIM